MAYRLSRRSESRLVGVYPVLAAVVRRAIEITKQDFAVFEGVRTPERQAVLYARGVTRTLNSRHFIAREGPFAGYGRAVDLVPFVNGRLDWSDKARWRYAEIDRAMVDALEEVDTDLRYDLEWGGNWRTFFDGAHHQIVVNDD